MHKYEVIFIEKGCATASKATIHGKNISIVKRRVREMYNVAEILQVKKV